MKFKLLDFADIIKGAESEHVWYLANKNIFKILQHPPQKGFLNAQHKLGYVTYFSFMPTYVSEHCYYVGPL